MPAAKVVDQAGAAAEAFNIDLWLFASLGAALVGLYFLVMGILKSTDNREVLRKMNTGKL
jgi:hypothetical protein